MNRSELVVEVARRTGLLAADVSIAMDGLKDALADAIRRGEKVTIPGFLTVESVGRAERQGRHPRTGEPMTVPAGFSAKLTAGQTLKSAAKSRVSG
jgi:DNA-binding protein HU-beta